MAEPSAEAKRAALIERVAKRIASYAGCEDCGTSASNTSEAAEQVLSLLDSGEAGTFLFPKDALKLLLDVTICRSARLGLRELRQMRADLARHRAMIENACELLDESWPETAATLRRQAGLMPPDVP